ncbi:nf-x1 finger and helicase domain-containing protein [Colletotrichum plurivorum]|uniref:Nf-x1 finger and helicase domain-containing protein n=1 Tax=Colletotrichum plurivorum TaxID=2175906 RepID=A0A8H6N7R7_9PEZI|nr:nf-x1 finger and helicase domain-containing protein [Colletotrichum plurivorum]
MLAAVEVDFDKWSGLEFIVRVDQPLAAGGLDKLGRAAWWVQSKRLTDGALVCIVDEIGTVLFFQVSRSTVRTPHNAHQHGQQTSPEGDDEGPRYSLPDDPQHAFVHLKLVDTSVDGVEKSPLWFKGMDSRQHRQLFESPSVLLPAFAPPLKALQTMSQKLDLPFQNLLTLHANKAKLGPIVCVCYTNHALDQLLEHLVDGGVKNIVRIGSRSKSERLGPVNLRQVVKDMTRTKMEGKALFESIEALNSDASYVLRRLEAYQFLNTNERIWQHLDTHHPRQCNELFGHGQYEDDDEEEEEDEDENNEGWQTLYRSKLWEMTHQERIIMYQDWMTNAFQTELDALSASQESYERKRERNNRVRSSIDLRCLQQANIIGVTTTGLATNLDLLRRVQGKVLLCEEAGEVLEAHLLTALLPTIEHAVLIGDHLQLRPQIQDWRLQRANPAGVKYSLDVSLFERLLVRSTLYPSLADSDAVQAYPAVCGMAKRLFWLHHESPESGRKSDQESVETSYSNDFEVDMVSSLVSHLLRQGVYKAGEIAVLTPYLGQLNKLRQKLGSTMQIVINDRDLDVLADMESPDGPAPPGQQNHAARSSALQGVRAATVDNFQGEEATVVIVSLVRSNSERRCGFLSTSNRINVLLSRARHGICGEPCGKLCMELLLNAGLKLPCGHILNKVECWRTQDPAAVRCAVQVEKSVPGCAAPCDWIPCTKRCTKVLECNHQCPSVCGEKCPDKKFCQQCASDEIKDTRADLIIFGDCRSVNLDEEPCIFPDCGHFLTYSSMDGQMGLQDFYEVSTEGIPTAIKSASHPFDQSQNIKVCPDCRSSLRNVSRYGRIVRRGLLDESTKRFISWSNMKWNELSGAFLAAREDLEAMDKSSFMFPTRHPEQFNLQGARHEQIQRLFTFSGSSRHKTMKKVRRQIVSFLELVRKEEQPYQRVAHLVWHVNRRRQKESSFAFDESTIQMGSYLQAMSLLLRCDLLVSDFVALCRNSSEPQAKSVKVETVKVETKSYIRDCERLIKIARTRKYVRQEVEGHIFVALFCSFVSPGEQKATSEGAGAHNAGNAGIVEESVHSYEEAKSLGQHHLEVATDLMDKHPSTAVLKPELERAWRTLRDGVFYTDVSVDELREVYQAMAQEFSGTGHWYRCLHGHPFTIGECGMAMELARCPECGGPVGGSNHQSVEGVQHAHDIEQLGTGVGSLRI